MKKRIISMLLTVLMVMSLFTGLSVNASAAQYNGANVINYTMNQGDFVLRICQKLGLNYYTCKDAIKILNNIQDGQWNKLSVGTTLVLPASDADAVMIANGASTSTVSSGASATTASTGTATTATVNNNTASGDVLGYYIVPYTLSYGETVSGVCNSLGVNFSIFGPFIKQLNNVSNWNKVRAGDTIMIPTPYAPSVGSTCYGVMEHIVTNSDTAYGIVTSKGLNYNSNERVLKVLNQTDNLAAVNAGQKFFYPVPLTVSVPGTGNPGSTATTTTTTTVTDGNGTTTTQTTTTAKLYSITGGMSAADGTMLFYVGSKPVTAASAGTKVTVVTSTNSGKAIQTLTVKHSDGSADLRLSGDTFIMPGCDVRVDATVKSGYDINISANYSGKAGASVNGISVQSAVKGAAVVIKSTDPNYEVSAVYASYKKMISASNKTVLTVSSANAFIMPAADVDVEVVMKPVSTYAFYVNDPVKGSFYLEVNGNPVTRAAKGAKVTVVAKGNDGYEPTNLEVTKHMTDGKKGESVNTFSNSFTMPGYDVDVTVTFGAKGNNILMMPTQLGVVRAFDANKGGTAGMNKAASADKDTDITDAETGNTVVLRAFKVNDNGVVTDEILTGYNIVYDVERNSDGLKVKLEKKTVGSNDYQTFVMPKGGVTVSATITTANDAPVKGEIYLNDVKMTAYSDCNIYVNYKDRNNKDVRAEFNGKAEGPVNIPALQYIDLRENSEDGISFVRYAVYEVKEEGSKVVETLSEELTNEANSRGYFQIPNSATAANTTLVIRAYFETGKVRINPAVITAGNGTVSFFTRPAFDMPMDFNDIPGAVLATLGTSVNSAEPNETVYVLAAPANGYKFDPDKYQTKLKVTRQDNGAALALTPVGPVLDTRTGGIWAYQYSFTMPAAGVDIECAFDAKPFRLYMKCVDETGKDISGLGLWQIAVNMEPGIVDNSMFAEAIGTVVNVEYGDYVTVAMTEAGWSKYDMVSFRIDGNEYTADSLNHFYNFQMIDERAKDLEIVAVMRPRVPYTVSIHNLYATYVDTTKGAAQFVILDSPTGYSNEYRTNRFNVPNYVNKAVYGDKVGVIVSSISNNYRVEAKDITLYTLGSDADRIVLKEEWVDVNGNIVDAGTADAYRVFTFTMPDSDVYISVNFTGTKNALAITVRDDKTNAPVRNAVQVITNNANNPVTYDVGTDFTFDDVPYNTQVSVLRSTQALAESKVITRVDIANATGKSIPYTSLAAAGEGITFTMPNEPVWVIVYVSDRAFDLPLNIVNRVTNGSFVFRKSANENDPTYALSDFNFGDTVYVHTTPNSGYAQLKTGELAILHNGVTNIATWVDEGVWSFTMPDGGTLIFQGDFVSKEAVERTIKILLKDASGNAVTDGEIKATASGSTASYGNGATLRVLEGQTITFTPDTASIIRIVSKSGKGLSDNTYTVPTDLTEAGGIWDEITITVNPKGNKTAEITITSPDGNVVISSTGLSGGFSKGENKNFTLDVGSTITVTSATAGLGKVTLTSASGKGVSGNTYTVPDRPNDTLTIHLSTDSNPINSRSITNGEVQYFTDSARTTPLTSLSNVARDTKVYIKTVPNTGYTLAESEVKIYAVIGNSAVAVDPDNSFTMPAGGVNVDAAFKTKTVKVAVTFIKNDTAKTAVTDASIKIKINNTDITYSKDSNTIDGKTGLVLSILPDTITSKYAVDSVKVYKGASDTKGTALKSTQYTLEGTETKMEFILKDAGSSSSGVTGLHNIFLNESEDSGETVEEVDNGEDAQVNENVAEEAADEAADEAEDSVPEDAGADELDDQVQDPVDDQADESDESGEEADA